jgi:hypothetical protein
LAASEPMQRAASAPTDLPRPCLRRASGPTTRTWPPAVRASRPGPGRSGMPAPDLPPRTGGDQTAPAGSTPFVRWGAPPGPRGRGPAGRSLRDGMPSPTSSCGQLVRVQRQLFSAYPQYLMLKGDHPYDEVDTLAADVCSTIKRRGDRFDSAEQLTSWLDEDGVSYTPGRLSAAVYQLERIGRLDRPRQDHWRSDLPLSGVYVEPRICPE